MLCTQEFCWGSLIGKEELLNYGSQRVVHSTAFSMLCVCVKEREKEREGEYMHIKALTLPPQ